MRLSVADDSRGEGGDDKGKGLKVKGNAGWKLKNL